MKTLSHERERILLIQQLTRPGARSNKRVLWGRQLEHLPKLSKRAVIAGKTMFLVPFDISVVSNEEKQYFLREDRWCQECGAYPKYQVLGRPNVVIMSNGAIASIDHIVPRALGGGDWLENKQLLCHYCNEEKGDQAPKGYEPKPGVSLTQNIRISA